MDEPGKPADESTPPPAPPSPPQPKPYQTTDLWLGVAIFVAMNGMLLSLGREFERWIPQIGIAALVLNIGLLILFARGRRRIALGMLMTLVSLLVLTVVCLPLVVIGICFTNP